MCSGDKPAEVYLRVATVTYYTKFRSGDKNELYKYPEV